MNKSAFLLFLILNFINIQSIETNDLTIVGFAKFKDGLGRIAIGLIDILKSDLKIDFIDTRKLPLIVDDIPTEVISIINSNKKNSPSNVALLTDVISCSYLQNHKLMPQSNIKLAYSMFESSTIPYNWGLILNKKFDALIVPDDYLVNSYKSQGVKIPIFVLPLGIYLNEFFNKIKTVDENKKEFVFGSIASFDRRKNLKKLVNAFINEFGTSSEVKLKINGRPYGSNQVLKDLQKKIKQLKIKNIEITQRRFSQIQYIKFMESIDCFVNISKGEGFSVTPREALALGIPCILSCNTAHITLCNSGFVRWVKSDILEPARYLEYGQKNIGYFFNCLTSDVQKALKDVYKNYRMYFEKAQQGRQWVMQYDWQNLKKRYLNLIKPKNVLLGDKNIVTNDYLMTNSKELYEKYKSITKSVIIS